MKMIASEICSRECFQCLPKVNHRSLFFENRISHDQFIYRNSRIGHRSLWASNHSIHPSVSRQRESDSYGRIQEFGSQRSIKHHSRSCKVSFHFHAKSWGKSKVPPPSHSLDLEKRTLSFDLNIPKLRINALYNLKGNILLLPLVGNGNVAMSMKDVKSTVYTKISIQKKPEEVIHIDEMKVTFLVGNMRIHLDNLFNGNKVLGASLNMFLNQNAKEVISELRTDLEHGLANIFTGLWNNVFSKLPIKLWLL